MKNYKTLLESLNPQLLRYVDYKLDGKSYDYTLSHSDMFSSLNADERITIPFHKEITLPDSSIKSHLLRHGWEVHDYQKGIAYKNTYDNKGNPKIIYKKIGKILSETDGDNIIHPVKSNNKPQSILKFYNNDPVRSSNKDDYNIIISRGKEDIASMSTNKKWDSCMTLPNGVNHTKIKKDFKENTLVAYLTRKGDDNIDNAVARVLIKPYESDTKGKNKHTIYRATGIVYGNAPPMFNEQINNLLKIHYPQQTKVNYTLSNKVYQEGLPEIHAIKRGLDNNSYRRCHYDNDGEFTDYIDEKGIHQPAILYHETKSYTHMKNGKIHRDNELVASVDDNGINYHYTNGYLHKSNDKPAVHKKVENGKYEQYYINGMLHRENNKPSIDIDQDGIKHKAYHLYDIEHRDGLNISNYEETPNTLHYTRKTWGVCNTNSHTKPSEYFNSKHSHGTSTITRTHLNGQLNSFEDNPAEIIHEQFNNGDSKITKKWFIKGDLDRENNKPHTVVKLNGKIIQTSYNRLHGSELPTEVIKENDFHYNTYNNRNENGLVYEHKGKHKDGDSYHSYQSGSLTFKGNPNKHFSIFDKEHNKYITLHKHNDSIYVNGLSKFDNHMHKINKNGEVFESIYNDDGTAHYLEYTVEHPAVYMNFKNDLPNKTEELHRHKFTYKEGNLRDQDYLVHLINNNEHVKHFFKGYKI